MTTTTYRVRFRRPPVLRYRGHYGIFTPLMALFWATVLLVEASFYAIYLVVMLIVVVVRALARASEKSSHPVSV